MEGDVDLAGGQRLLQVLLLMPQLLRRCLRFPLEGREGLRHEGGGGNAHVHTASLGLVRILIIGVHHLFGKKPDPLHVFVRFGRQPQHEIELDGGITARERDVCGFEHFFLGDVFVDDVAHTLRARLRRKGQAGAAHGFELLQKLVREIIHAQARQRHVHLLAGRPVQQKIEQLLDFRIIGGGQGAKRDLVIPRLLDQPPALLVDDLGALFADRTVQKARLTEAAAADAAAEDLMRDAVMHHVDERHDEGLGIIDLVEIADDALCDRRRRAVLRGDRPHGPVLLIGDIIERRHVYAGDPGSVAQKFFFRGAALFVHGVEIHDLTVDLLPFAEGKQVEKVRDRLRVAGAGAAAHHDGSKTLAVRRAHRQTGKIQHIEDVRIAQLILQREADKVEIPDRVAAFERVKRDVLLPHFFFHIRPRRKHALAPGIRALVRDGVEDLDPEMAHTDLIGIREAERIADIHRVLVLHHLIQLTAGIARGLLHGRQKLFNSFIHGKHFL